jgi:hypothetical protein
MVPSAAAGVRESNGASTGYLERTVMAYAVALILEEKLGNQVRKVWDAFQAAGIGTTPGQFGEPPHISLVDCPQGPPDVLHHALDETGAPDAGIRLIPFGVFPGQMSVVYYNALLSDGLLHVHRKLYSFLADRGIAFNPLYSPGQVVFHCTAAVDIDLRQFPEAMSIMRDNSEPLAGQADRVQLFEYFPIKVLRTKELHSA